MSKFSWNLLICLALMALLCACQAAPTAPSITPTPGGVPSPARPTAVPQTPPVAQTRSPLWTFQTQGAVYSSPLVRDGVVYFGSDDRWLYAVDAATGQQKWKFETADFVRSRPALDLGMLYFASDDGNLYALDPQTGAEKWKLDFGNGKKMRKLPADDYNWDYLQSSPTVSGGVIYIGSIDGGLYAVDARTGKQLWRFQTGERVRSTPAVADGVVYVGSWDGFIYALDAKTGAEKWKVDARGQWNQVQPSPLVVNGVVYIGSRSYRMFALDAATGQQKWAFQYKEGWVESSPALADGVIYVGSSMDDKLYALDHATGQKLWAFDADGVVFSSPVVDNGIVYAGTAYWASDKGHYFYALDTHTYQDAETQLVEPSQARWRVEIGPTLDTSPTKIHGVVSSPAVSAGVVYFGGLDGKLYAVPTGP